MICHKCNRLCPDESSVCPHCSEVFDAEKYVEELQQSEPDLSVKVNTASASVSADTKYFKWGWVVVASLLSVFVGFIILLFNIFSPIKAVVEDYTDSFYNGNFQGTVMASSVNMEKCFEAQKSNNQFDFFGFFSSGYSSYDEMMSAYADAFTQNKEKISSIYGNDYKISLDIEKQVKVNETVLFNILNNYNSKYGDILRDGDITGIRYIYATVSISGSLSSISEIVQYIVIEIDGDWYVLTDDSLDSLSNV